MDKEYFKLAYKYEVVIACPQCDGYGTLFHQTAVDDGYDVICDRCDNTGYVHNREHYKEIPLKDLLRLFVKTDIEQILSEMLAEEDEDGDHFYVTADGAALVLSACDLPSQGGVVPRDQ